MAYNRAPERWDQSNYKGCVVIDTMDISGYVEFLIKTYDVPEV